MLAITNMGGVRARALRICDHRLSRLWVHAIGESTALQAYVNGTEEVWLTVVVYRTGRPNAEPSLGITDTPLGTSTAINAAACFAA